MTDNSETVEKLAEIEHEQWAHWTSYMLDNMSDKNVQRWRDQIKTPYNDLNETEKDSDREWARKALAAIREDLLTYAPPKPLEWKGPNHEVYADRGPFTYSTLHPAYRGYSLYRNGTFIGDFSTLEAAQAAANDDLCNRVKELF